jgi:voltage-gated potassium channel
MVTGDGQDEGMSDPGTTPSTLACDPDEEPSARERAAALVEQRLDIPMAVLAVVWAGLVAYELVAPARQRDALALVGNLVWLVFVVEFVAKLWVSGNPVRFLRRRWPSVLFLVLPALRVLRVVRALRVVRLLPAARVVGSSYRAIGTARSLLGGRLVSLVVISAVVVLSGGQLLFLTERVAGGRPPGLGDALWWSANLALSGNLVFEPESLLSRLVSVLLGIYAVVVFASVAAALGAFLIESRAERAAVEDRAEGAG